MESSDVQVAPLEVADGWPAMPTRGLLKSRDPNVIAAYERLVVSVEGLSTFLRMAMAGREVQWATAANRALDLVRSAQRELEVLR